MPKQRFYHWSAAFRIQHWFHVAAITVLVFTGYYIHSAFFSGTAEAMAWNRWFHLLGAYVLIFGFIWRVYLMFNSYEGADWREILPLWRNLKHLPEITAYYLFMKDTHRHYHRYNPLQALAYTVMGICIIVMACTGFAIHGGWLHSEFAWVNGLLGGVVYTRLVHFFGMWALIALTLVHVYFAVRQNAIDRDRSLMSMIDGYCYRVAE